MAGALVFLKIIFFNFKQLLAGTEVKKKLLKNSKFKNLEL
jgi:hypothetical protein